jgi:2-polyprenyl-6-hydroxyphenyl methylase/3-demethylubiquinone-9 3-methyltransferase
VVAEASLVDLLGIPTLAGRTFLDVGCGSGLFSLAARRLGAHVHSFDFDTESVACAQALKSRYYPGDPNWTIESGSALYQAYLGRLGKFDVVYSWGVLHHTGSMWQALENVIGLLKPGGTLCVAIYNDQGWQSTAWRQIKRLYNRLPSAPRMVLVVMVGFALETATLAHALLSLQLGRYLRRWVKGDRVRGMNRWHDLVDWVGGYPFEVATPSALVGFYERRGLISRSVRSCGNRMGCNEYVLERPAAADGSPSRSDV